jgi:chromate transporter
MIYWQIFLAFLIPGILGYGGGPASIPLVEKEVVDRYEWMTNIEFSELLAIANTLPGPIATKMAGYVGYAQGGVLGSIVGIFATVAPSLILMIVLLGILLKHKESPKVKRLSNYVRPLIAALMAVLTFNFFSDSTEIIGAWQTILIAALSFLLLEKCKVHPAYVIVGAMVYGAIFLV